LCVSCRLRRSDAFARLVSCYALRTPSLEAGSRTAAWNTVCLDPMAGFAHGDGPIEHLNRSRSVDALTEDRERDRWELFSAFGIRRPTIAVSAAVTNPTNSWLVATQINTNVLYYTRLLLVVTRLRTRRYCPVHIRRLVLCCYQVAQMNTTHKVTVDVNLRLTLI
jgi:hypothetical protein